MDAMAIHVLLINDLCISYCKPSTIWYNFYFGISSDKSLFCKQATTCFPFPQLFMTLLWDSHREGCRLQVPSKLLPSNPFHHVRNPFWRCQRGGRGASTRAHHLFSEMPKRGNRTETSDPIQDKLDTQTHQYLCRLS
jgi:hypothetical protein